MPIFTIFCVREHGCTVQPASSHSDRPSPWATGTYDLEAASNPARGRGKSCFRRVLLPTYRLTYRCSAKARCDGASDRRRDGRCKKAAVSVRHSGRRTISWERPERRDKAPPKNLDALPMTATSCGVETTSLAANNGKAGVSARPRQ